MTPYRTVTTIGQIEFQREIPRIGKTCWLELTTQFGNPAWLWGWHWKIKSHSREQELLDYPESYDYAILRISSMADEYVPIMHVLQTIGEEFSRYWSQDRKAAWHNNAWRFVGYKTWHPLRLPDYDPLEQPRYQY